MQEKTQNAGAIGFGTTPLYNACQFGFALPENSLAVVQLLLASGADPNQRIDYDSPISGRLDRGLTALMFAATAHVAQTLLDAGATVDATDEHGVTPLMRAAARGGAEVVKLLIQRGANPKAKSKTRTTAADFARSKLEMFAGHVVGPGGVVDQKVKDRVDAYQAVLDLLES
ncbi:MAG: ankyrin repeat domain-containing protein [Planctomycetaceae bacterium]|nr:ankyrin repeat domain-containing protein [Planctomycetaceae bacterium]